MPEPATDETQWCPYAIADPFSGMYCALAESHMRAARERIIELEDALTREAWRDVVLRAIIRHLVMHKGDRRGLTPEQRDELRAAMR
jgi:hypothetical protein